MSTPGFCPASGARGGDGGFQQIQGVAPRIVPRIGFSLIDLFMGLLRGAVFHHGGVPENSPLALLGRFLSSMGRFPTLLGCFPTCLNGNSPLRKAHEEVLDSHDLDREHNSE